LYFDCSKYVHRYAVRSYEVLETIPKNDKHLRSQLFIKNNRGWSQFHESAKSPNSIYRLHKSHGISFKFKQAILINIYLLIFTIVNSAIHVLRKQQLCITLTAATKSSFVHNSTNLGPRRWNGNTTYKGAHSTYSIILRCTIPVKSRAP